MISLPQRQLGYLDYLISTLPIQDRVACSKLNHTAIASWAVCQVEEYQRRIREFEYHIATLRSVRNAGSPIHTLPPELLIKIFTETYTTRRDLRIAHVCRYWHSLIQNTPCFWANAISSEAPFDGRKSQQEFLHVALSRSGVIPLHLTINHGFRTAWAGLSDHRQRISSLKVRVSKAASATLQRALSSGMSSLRELHAFCDVVDPGKLVLDDASLPNLRELCLDGGFVTTTSTVSSLERLTISGMIRDPTDLGDAVRRCSSLRSLSLQQTLPAEWAAKSYDSCLTGVDLPHLRYLSIEDSHENTHQLLFHLCRSPSTTVNISPFYAGGDPFRTAIPGRLPALYGPPAIDRLVIQHPMKWGDVSVQCYGAGDSGEEERFGAMTYVDRSTQDDLDGLLEPLLELDVRTLTISLDSFLCSDPHHVPWAGFFQRMSHLRRLEVTGDAPRSVGPAFVRWFLECCGNPKGAVDANDCDALELAWIPTIRKGDVEGSGTTKELRELLDILKEGLAGRRRLGRLELYGVEDTHGGPFLSVKGAPTNADMTRTITAPFMSELSDYAAVVVCR